MTVKMDLFGRVVGLSALVGGFGLVLAAPVAYADGDGTTPPPSGTGGIDPSTITLDPLGPEYDEFRFERGDVDDNGSLQINDAIQILNYLYTGGYSPDCIDAADIDDDGSVQINDAVMLLNYLYNGGPAPAFPHQTFGLDPTADGLSCRTEPGDELLGCLASDIGSCGPGATCDVWGYCVDDNTFRDCAPESVDDDSAPPCGAPIYMLDGEAVYAEDDAPVILADGSNELVDISGEEPETEGTVPITGTFVRCEGIPVGVENLAGETPDPEDVCKVGGCYKDGEWVLGCCVPPAPGGETCVCGEVDISDPPYSEPPPTTIPYVTVEHGECRMEITAYNRGESNLGFVSPDETGSHAHNYISNTGVGIGGNVRINLTQGVRSVGQHVYAQHGMAVPNESADGIHSAVFSDRSTGDYRMGWKVTDDSTIEAATDWRDVEGRLLDPSATDPTVRTKGSVAITGSPTVKLDYKTWLTESRAGQAYTLAINIGGAATAGVSAVVTASLSLSVTVGNSISLTDYQPEQKGNPSESEDVSGQGIGSFTVLQKSSSQAWGEFRGNPGMAEWLNRLGTLANTLVDVIQAVNVPAGITIAMVQDYIDDLIQNWLDSMASDSGGHFIALPKYESNVKVDLYCIAPGESTDLTQHQPVRRVKIQ